MAAPDPEQLGIVAKYGGWVVTTVATIVTLGIAVVGGLLKTLRGLRHGKADKENVDKLHVAVLDLYKKRDGLIDALTEHTQRDEDNMNRLNDKIDKKFDGLTTVLMDLRK